MPLTAENQKQINDALKGIEAVKADIAKAKMAGLQVTDLEEQLKSGEEQLRKIKQVYFPNSK